MEERFWNVFCDTGDPMCYLLYRAEEKKRERETQGDGREASQQQTHPTPTASF